MVENLGLDFTRFAAYRNSDAAYAKVLADIDLGIRSGVDGTPSVFINGRQAYDARPEALQAVITHEIEHAGHASTQTAR